MNINIYKHNFLIDYLIDLFYDHSLKKILLLRMLYRKMNFLAEDLSTVKDERMKKLIKWREERNRKKKLEAAKKKPVFKVGIVHHSLSSPWTKNDISSTTKSPKQIKHQNDIPKRITKVTEKRIQAKQASVKQTTITKNAPSTSTKHPINSNIKNLMSDKKKQKSFAPVNHQFRPPSGLQNMPLFGLVPVEQTPQEKGDFFTTKKPIECKVLDTSNVKNDKKNKLLQELSIHISDIKKSTTEFKVSSPKLALNKRKSLENLNRPISDSNNTTFESKKTVEASNKHVNIEKDSTINESHEEKSLSDNNDMKTPSQKAVSVKSIDSADANTKDFDTENLIAFSPYLTLSRGKKNARKEQQQRLGIGRLSSIEIPTKDTVMERLNISVEEEERTAQYFKFLLNKETNRLQNLCKKWLDVQSEEGITDDAIYEINQAMGQTNLLINKKFERFRSLVQDCETGKGEMLVTCRDLQGFWDMTYMEVQNCDIRFEKLEQRRNRGWQEEDYAVNKFVSKRKRMPAKKQIVSKPSSLRSLILAARKKKMETEIDLSSKEDLQVASQKHISTSSPSSRKSITFKENNSVRRSTRSSLNERKSISAQNEDSKINLIQKINFSSASKKLRSPFAAMKISQMCKTPEVQLDDTITYVNSDQTPSKGILKKSEEIVNKEVRIKSAHKVNFDDDIILTKVPLDEEEQIKSKLAAALNKIDNLDLDELSVEESINAEKKLNFETEDSDSSINFDELATKVQTQFEKQSKSLTQNISDFNVDSCNDVTSSVSFKETSSNNEKIITPRKSLRHRTRYMNTSDKEAEYINVLPEKSLKTNVKTPIISETISNTEIEQDNESKVKILRNRIIMTNDTVKINRTSKMVSYYFFVFFLIFSIYLLYIFVYARCYIYFYLYCICGMQYIQ